MGGRWHIELDNDVEAHMPWKRFDEGTPLTLRFENGEEIQGHVASTKEDDVEGHSRRYVTVEGPDVEGHMPVTPEDVSKRVPVTLRLESGDEVTGHAFKR